MQLIKHIYWIKVLFFKLWYGYTFDMLNFKIPNHEKRN
jgi:hypothetical protein